MQPLSELPSNTEIVSLTLGGAEFITAVDVEENEDAEGNPMPPTHLVWAVKMGGRWWLLCDMGELEDALQARAEIEFAEDWADKARDGDETGGSGSGSGFVSISAYAEKFGLPA